MPAIVFALAALFVLFRSNKNGGLKAIIVASYCGAIIVTFTRGASGGIWLTPLFLVPIAFGVYKRSKKPAYATRITELLFYTLIFFFAYGIVIGFFRYDFAIADIKSGVYSTLFGLPTPLLMGIYRVHILIALILAFVIPLLYDIDRDTFIKCLKLCWFFTLVLSILAFLYYFNIADTSFSDRSLEGFTNVGIMGFYKASIGLMIMMGVFLSFALVHLMPQNSQKYLVFLSIPICVTALILTFSRTAVLGLLAGSIIFAIFVSIDGRIKGVLTASLSGVLIYLVILQSPALSERFGFLLSGKFGIESSSSRLVEWGNLLKGYSENPDVFVFGVGFQNFHYFLNLQENITRFQTGHNSFLHILSEVGVFGLFVFISWLVSIFLWLFSWRNMMQDRASRILPNIFISIVCALVICSITTDSLVPTPSMIAWLLHFFIILGIWISYYRTYMGKRIAKEK